MEYKIKTKWNKYSLESRIKQPQLSAPHTESIESWFLCHYELRSAWLTLYSRPNDLPSCSVRQLCPVLQVVCCPITQVSRRRSRAAPVALCLLSQLQHHWCSTNQLWLLYRNLIRLSFSDM